MKHFVKQNSSLCSLHGKIGIQINNTVYTKREKLTISFYKPFRHKTPPSNVYYIHVIIYNIILYYIILWNHNLLFEYGFIGIVKPKFTRGNEI